MLKFLDFDAHGMFETFILHSVHTCGLGISWEEAPLDVDVLLLYVWLDFVKVGKLALLAKREKYQNVSRCATFFQEIAID